MNVWTTHSNPFKQTILSAACAIAGLVLVIGFRDFSGFRSNSTAGFSLGMLLLLIGVAGFLLGGRQTVTVDPVAHSITVEDSNLFRTKKRLIPFSAIVGIGIGYLGKKSTYVTWYYLVLGLSSGEEYPLFSPGRFFEGSSDRSTVLSWKHRLEEYLHQ
jgi:hypothetical protein